MEFREITAGQDFIVDKFQEADAEGMVNLFLGVYGEHYPIRTYYSPSKIIEENRKKNVYSIVARTENGDIVGHAAFHRSSPHNSNLYELGIMLILPNYRETFAAYSLMSYALENYIHSLDVDGAYGEAVCNLTATQKVTEILNMTETGIEPGLMPASAYDTEKSADGRVTCIMSFIIFRKKACTLYLPERYFERVKKILRDFPVERELKISDEKPPKRHKTGASVKYFSFAQVLRVNVFSVGADFAGYANRQEKKYTEKGAEVLQFFINVKESWANYALEFLAEKGFYMAGVLPCWFGSDGILMMKNLKGEIADPVIYSRKAKEMLADILQEKNLPANAAGRR